MSREILRIPFESTYTLKVRSLRRDGETAFVVDGDVTSVEAQVLDDSGSAITGITDPLPFSAVAGVDGGWDGTIPGSGVGWSIEDRGWVKYVATLTDGTVATQYQRYEVCRG